MFWEIGKLYSTKEIFYVFSLKWWPKGANFLIEIKYHILRAQRTSTGPSRLATRFFDWFDGGSENRNFPNLAFLSEFAIENKVVTEGSRLVPGHSHNDGDALIKAPRESYKSLDDTKCASLLF